MKNIKTKIIAAILSLTLIFQAGYVEIGAKAETAKNDATPNITKQNADKTISENIDDLKIVSEVTDKREENVKHFMLNNGTFMAVTYNEPVHIKNNNGFYEDIDNSLTEDENSGEFKQKHSLNKIKLAKNTDSAKLVKMQMNGYNLSWNFEGINKSKVIKTDLKEKGENLNGNEKFTSLQNLTGKAKYENIFNDTDLEYYVGTENVKENIILKSKNAPDSFIINYNIDKLTAKQEDSKTINLLNGNEVVFTLSAPEMTDALGEMSTDITLEILSVKNKKLTVKCTADKDWINNKNRVFPITVDPSAVFMLGSNNIIYKYSYTNTSVTENAPGTLYVGYDTTLGTACSTIKLNSLPSLSKGDMVYNAQLALYLNHFRLDTKTKEINIDAYEVNGNWGGYAYSTVYVKGNGPAFFSNVLDYQKASAALMHNYKYWDITKLVKKWYNGAANNGIVLKASNTYTTDDNLALFSTPENAPVGTDYKKPAFIIYYLNAKGLEDYWSYSESSAGSAAASVNNYTGNLVASVPLSSTTSSNMPAELSLYYNNCQSGNHFSNSICGGNFKTNYDIVINAISAGTALNNALRAEGYYYTYTDSDGTVHYMKTTATDKSDKGTYKDESGLGLTLTKSNGFVLEDKDHNKMKFDAQGKITQIFNKYSASTTEDTIRFSYTGNFLSSITDGSGKKLTLARNQNNALISVTDEFGRKTALNYSGSKMVKVDYPNGNSVKFSYTSDYLLEKLTAEDGTYLLFNYPSSGTAVDKSRVSKVTEYSNNAEQRNYVTFTYNIDNTTTIKDENNNSETYVFDNIGRAFSVYSDDGAASSEWQTVTGANATFTNNKVKTSYAAEKPIINRLNNPGFEGSDGLTGWSKTGGNVTSANNIKYIGQKAVKINHTSQSTDSVYQNITDSTGLYTLSAYVKTENITAAGNTFGGCLYISYKNNGTEYTKRSKYLTGTNDWDRIYFSEDIPGSATDVKAGFRLENASGTAYIDNMQFESGYISDYNMAQNTCFEKGNTGYMGTVNAGNISSGAPSYLKKSTKINGAAGNAYYIGQTVFIGKPAKNLAINVAAYAKANSVAIKDNRSFGVKVFFYYTDGTQELCPVKSFNPYTTAWQYMSYVAMTGSAHQNKTVNYINVYFIYDYNRNSAEFTGLTVKIDPTAQSFSYDSKGNVQSAKTAGGKEGYNNFDSTTNNLLSNSDSKNGHFTYTYNTGDYKYQLKKANHSGYTQQFDFEYNSHGQVTKQTQHHTNATTYPVYQSTNEYSQNGSKLLSQTNTTDIKTSYNYDSYDRVASVTSGGISTNYTYDSSNRVTSVSAKRDKNNNETTVTNNYTYDSFGKLLNIQHGNTNYAFTYNNFGEKTSTKVGNRVLAQYSYDSRGNIKSTSYGNGNVTQNTYDNKNRLTNITKTGGCSNSYFYNSAGQLAKESYTSPQYSVTQNYLYDLLGRVVNVNFENKNLTVNYGYNNIDQLTKVRYNLNGSNHGVDYTYYNWNINLTSTLTNGTVVKKDLGHLAQLHHLTHYNTSGKAVRRTVTNTVRNNKDIGLPATITYKNGTFASNNFTPDEQSTVSYNYTYDYFGNLTEVFKNGEKQEQYAYDDLSQLVRADNKQNNTTTEYTYDNHSNLLSTRTTAFTFGEIDRSAPYTLTDYSYNDSSWGDLLTAYNGAAITYDEIGNPINYYNGAVMQWTGGRNLSQYQKGSNTYSYAYNANNLRTLKTVNGVTTEYYLDGSKIIAMQTGEGAEGLLKYYYDADGTRLAVESNGKIYYYKYNTTGDVISLMDEDFNDIAYYSYNAYGKPESVTDASGNDISQNSEHIANKNPFRYRGYYYDSETGLYYLQSRYYDPEIGRFINADNTIAGVGGDVRGYNLFSYCMNNPVNMSDHTGNWPQWIKKAVRAVVKAVKKAVAVVINAFKPARSSVKNIVKTSSNSLSPKGKPGSSQTLPNSDGTPKQKRWYGPDGTPERDRDYNHPGNMPFPHDHKWENGERGTDHLPPDPSYKMNWEPVIGVGLVVICVAGIIVVAADDATGIGVADDVLFGPLGAGVSKGLIKIFG